MKNNKKGGGIWLLFGIVVLVVIASVIYCSLPKAWETYQNTNYGLEFKHPSDVAVEIKRFVAVGGTNFILGGNYPVAEGTISGGKIQTDNHFSMDVRVYPAVSNLEAEVKKELPGTYTKVNSPIAGGVAYSNGENNRAYVQNSKYVFEIFYSKVNDDLLSSVKMIGVEDR